MDLEEFDFDIEYIKGKENVVADALSRISIKDLFKMYEENHIFKIEIAPSRQIKNQKNVKNKNIRAMNSVLAFTRSMTKAQQNTENYDRNLTIQAQRQKNKMSMVSFHPIENTHACALQILKPIIMVYQHKLHYVLIRVTKNYSK